jgi:voltage-gated potassium channel
MNKQIEDLDRHVIICGYGRLGMMLAKELREGKSQFVIIEPSLDSCNEAKQPKIRDGLLNDAFVWG